MAETRRVHLRITGRVQGVSFRWYAREQAETLGLSGWVRNCPDHSVEAEVEGSPEAIERFVFWAHQGPSGARVERVETQPMAAMGKESGFRIRH